MQLRQHPNGMTYRLTDDGVFAGMVYLCADCNEQFSAWDDRAYSTDGMSYYCGLCTRKRRMGRASNVQPIRPRIEIDVPARYATASLLDLKPQPRSFLTRWPQSTPLLAIRGIPGSGKTHACWSVAKELANRGIRVRMQAATDLKAEWIYKTRGHYGAHDWERSVQECAYLIVDDISGPTTTDGWVEFFHQLLDKRASANRPTLITSAVDGEQIEAKYNRPIRSRLNFWTWLTLPATDHRMQPSACAAVPA